MAVPDCPVLYIHHFKVGHDVRGQSWTVRMSVVVRYNQLELKREHIGTRITTSQLSFTITNLIARLWALTHEAASVLSASWVL